MNNTQYRYEDKIREYKLEAIEFCLSSGISTDLINEDNVELFIRENYKNLILSMKETVYGCYANSHLRIPRTWFDMWLIQRAPKWLAKMFKINYLELSVKETSIIPGVNVPKHQKYFVLTEVEQAF